MPTARARCAAVALSAPTGATGDREAAGAPVPPRRAAMPVKRQTNGFMSVLEVLAGCAARG
eukprot:155396-Chlamydomonas_euryale.AAC.10